MFGNYEKDQWIKLLRWYGHIGCTTGDMLAKIYNSTVECRRKKGRIKKRWTDAVSEIFKDKGASDGDAIGMIANHVHQRCFVHEDGRRNGDNELTSCITLNTTK